MSTMTLLRRIFLLVSGVFFALLAVTIVLMYLFFSDLLIRNAQDYLHLIVQQRQRLINTSLQRVDEVVVGLTNDRFIYEQVAVPVSKSYVDQAIVRQELNRYVVRSVYVPLRRSFRQVNYWFFVNDALPGSRLYASYSFPANRVLTMARARDMGFFDATVQSQGRVHWFIQPDKPTKVYAAVLVRSTLSVASIPDIGMLLLEFDVADLLVANQTGATAQSEYFLVDAQGEIVGVPGHTHNVDVVRQFLRQYANHAQSTAQNQTVAFASQLFSVFALDSGWLLVGVTPFTEITSQTHQVSAFVWPLLGVSLVAVLLLSYVIARSVARPIARLSYIMQQSSQQSDFDVPVPESAQTIEIALLYASYRAFVQRIKQLLHDVYLTGISVKQAEIRALQAQINPHFLYNTLDSISWVALDHGDEDVPRVVSSLSNILRYSINDSDRLVTLAAELAIVRDYLDIQNFCYQLNIQLEVEPALAEAGLLLPKLTLQPIIENAVVHGFLEQKQTTGVIQLRLWREGADAYCEIENPGYADVEAMNALLHDGSEPKKHGIRNVHLRLRMLFGSESGLHFYRTATNATVAVLTIRSGS